MFYGIAAIVLLVMLVVFALVILPWLAEENILFTTVKEGTVKTIMRGESFERFIMSFAEYHLNDPSKKWYDPTKPDWEVLYHGKGKDSDYDDRSLLLIYLGLYWIGWTWRASVYIYQFEWNEVYTDMQTGKEKILSRAEPTDLIYVADFTYAVVTDGAETQDRLSTDELTLVTIAVRNPYRALFSGEDWMRRISAAINRHMRNFVGEKDFQDLISMKDWTAFSTPIVLLNDKLSDDVDPRKLPWGLKGRYGVEIRTADLQTIDLSGDAKRINQEATTKEYVAKQEAAATKLKGQAEADVIQMKGDKEAEALDARLKVIKKHGDEGILLAQLDAMQEAAKGAGNTVIWANNPFIPKGGGK